MLSPGQWHKEVPKEWRANLEYRLRVMRECHENPSRQEQEVSKCREDLLYWVNAYVNQYNPNTIGQGSREIGPFITWPFQDCVLTYGDANNFGILQAIEDRQSLLIDKSREMGASWMCLLVMDWMFLFQPLKRFLMISRDEAAVDRPGDPDCLFWKLDFIHEYLPDWMTQKKIRRRKMGFSHKGTGSTITGQASTKKAGVGGRCTAMFVDEYGHIEADTLINARTAHTTDCRIFNSTHAGLDTEFYRMSQRPDMRKATLHWTQHPDKRKGLYRWSPSRQQIELLDASYPHPADYSFDLTGSPSGGPFPGLRSPWYDKKCREVGSERKIAEDLDINPSGSVSQFGDPLKLRSLIEEHCREPYWEGEVNYDRETGELLSPHLIQSAGGRLKLWAYPQPSGEMRPGRYSMGCDLSWGKGATNSCLTAFCADTGEKIAEYVTPFMDPKQFGVLAVALARSFKDRWGTGAKLGWEMLGPGEVFRDKVVELGYRNLLYRENESYVPWERRTTKSPGWHPSDDTRTVLLEEYLLALYSNQFINRSRASMDELYVYKYNERGKVVTGKPQNTSDDFSGAGANHGDRVIADGIAWKIARDMAVEVAEDKKEEIPVNSLAWRRKMRQTDRRRA